MYFRHVSRLLYRLGGGGGLEGAAGYPHPEGTRCQTTPLCQTDSPAFEPCLRHGSCEPYTLGGVWGRAKPAPRPHPGRCGGAEGPSTPALTVKVIAAKRNLVLERSFSHEPSHCFTRTVCTAGAVARL